MLTVFNLVEANQAKLLPEIVKLLKANNHHSKLSDLEAAAIHKEILKINANAGIVMLVQNMGQAEGTIILEKKNDIEVSMVDLAMRKGYEARALEVLFSQAQKKMKRSGYTQLFGSMDWFRSVEDKNVSGKLLQVKS